MNSKHVVVIGGGITGLSAAWELQKQASGQVRISVLEKTDRWGGKIHTKELARSKGETIIVDGGPESFITRKPEVWDLAHDLGIQDQLTEPGSETSHMFVLSDGQLQPVPLGPGAFLRSTLLTPRGKLRLLAEPWMPPKGDDQDESLADFASRRLGVEAMEKFIAPILGGIYNSDPQRQSILTTSPVMREMEAEYGSLFKAAFARMRDARRQSEKGKRPRFVAFASGAQKLVDSLVSELDADLLLNANIHTIAREKNGCMVELDAGVRIFADAIIMAAPANAAAKLLHTVAPNAAAELGKIRHENIGTLTLAYRAADVELSQRIHGLMIPRREGRAIDAVTFTSLKMPDRAPRDVLMVRVFFGGGAPWLVEVDPSELVSVVRSELADLLGITADPLEVIFFRWARSFPQADVGHLDRISAIEAMLPEDIYLAGSSYRGIGVPDCIRQGQQAARNLIAFLMNVDRTCAVQ